MSAPRREIRPITREGVAAALLKAHRYRVLNDSVAAESICLDVLAVEPTNVEALVMHVLAISDQFPAGNAEDLRRAEAAVARLTDPYKNAYYQGVVAERWAKSILTRGIPHAHQMAYEFLDKALGFYAKADALKSPGNDEAILRWNTCLRVMQRDPKIKAREAEAWEPSLE